MTRKPLGRIDEATEAIDSDQSIMPIEAVASIEPKESLQPSGIVEQESVAIGDEWSVPSETLEQSRYQAVKKTTKAQRITLWTTLSFILLMWLVWCEKLWQMWHSSTVLAAPVTLVSVVIWVLLLVATRREYRSWSLVDETMLRHQQVRQAVSDDDLVKLQAALADTLTQLERNNPSLVQNFRLAVSGQDTVQGYLKQLHNLVIVPLDEQADELIRKNALSIGVTITFVPHPSLDAIVVLWRGLVMTRQIGTLYGLKPTGLSSFYLFRYTMTSAALAAATDVGVDTLAESLASGMSETMLKAVGRTVAETGVTAWRMYRLGKMTQAICKPYSEELDNQFLSRKERNRNSRRREAALRSAPSAE